MPEENQRENIPDIGYTEYTNMSEYAIHQQNSSPFGILKHLPPNIKPPQIDVTQYLQEQILYLEGRLYELAEENKILLKKYLCELSLQGKLSTENIELRKKLKKYEPELDTIPDRPGQRKMK